MYEFPKELLSCFSPRNPTSITHLSHPCDVQVSKPSLFCQEDLILCHNSSQNNHIDCTEQVSGSAQTNLLNDKFCKLCTILLCHVALWSWRFNHLYPRRAFMQRSACWKRTVAVFQGLTIRVGVSTSPGAGHLAVQVGGWSNTHAVVPARWCNMAQGLRMERRGTF